MKLNLSAKTDMIMCLQTLPAAKFDSPNKFHNTGPLRNVDCHFLPALSLH